MIQATQTVSSAVLGTLAFLLGRSCRQACAGSANSNRRVGAIIELPDLDHYMGTHRRTHDTVQRVQPPSESTEMPGTIDKVRIQCTSFYDIIIVTVRPSHLRLTFA